MEMLRSCHLAAGFHTSFPPHIAEPLKSHVSRPLESAWLGARLPHSCAEYAYSHVFEGFCRFQNLVSAFCAARAGYDQRRVVFLMEYAFRIHRVWAKNLFTSPCKYSKWAKKIPLLSKQENTHYNHYGCKGKCILK